MSMKQTKKNQASKNTDGEYAEHDYFLHSTPQDFLRILAAIVIRRKIMIAVRITTIPAASPAYPSPIPSLVAFIPLTLNVVMFHLSPETSPSPFTELTEIRTSISIVSSSGPFQVRFHSLLSFPCKVWVASNPSSVI